MKIKLVVFDLAGTTVDDVINGLPLVAVAMVEAFKKSGHVLEPLSVDSVRGMEKKEAIRTLLSINAKDYDSSLAEKIFIDFKELLDQNLNRISSEIPGTTNVFRELKNQNIFIAVGSGFPHKVVKNIVQTFDWVNIVDFVSSAEAEGHGRPHPCLINSAMEKFHVLDARQVIKVGDTKLDIQEGKNAGCWTVAVLTGTQGKTQLSEESPDFIIDSVADLPGVLHVIQST